MGVGGRFACIFTPMALTIASLVCLIIVGLGGTNKNSSSLNNLYFFRANTTNIQIDPNELGIPSNPLTDGILNETTGVVKNAIGIADFYHISLWNYCSGNSTDKSGDHVTYCSPRKNEFWFNPVEVWNLNQTGVDHLFSKELRDGLHTYQTVAKWMFIAYIVAVITTIVEIIIGFFALLSRWGSLATTIISTISSFFVLAFALTATILYAVLTGTFNHALTKYDIHGHLGHGIYVAAWLAVAFSLGAGLFWVFSSCCCSGRSDRIKGYGDGPTRRKYADQQGPYQYERVESPLQGGQSYGVTPYESGPGYQAPNAHHGVPLGNVANKGTAYEPYRHENA